ncbi:hypothetical protein SAMN04488105_110125 [Salipiger thiooxidans]|uniref:Uncharacterized protein n=1 Tax=Salipiger thiooxidans TaxID=282683 RepID=A0A1G7H8C6_9RHOB|nr:hypothetical protein SAMN04488105_110125 [Salipiger thiooxidans]
MPKDTRQTAVLYRMVMPEHACVALLLLARHWATLSPRRKSSSSSVSTLRCMSLANSRQT